jgi:two-component system sensor histidine kinase/response regulator
MLEAAGVRVLLVDDDEDEYVIVGDLLWAASREGYHLTWAPTYEQGLQAIQATAYDVCLVDYRLGQRSGLDLLAEVTALSNHPQVILLTGDGDRGVDVTATKAGAADYLVKGEMTAALLERSIRYAVERGRALKALRAASELAQSMNLAKSAFVAAMSHEIRTPMNAILGMADMLWESELDADQREYVDVLRRAGAGLLALINDILDLSKIEAGRLELEHVEFDLEDVVDQAIELTAVKSRAKGIELLAHLPAGVATWFMGDPTRLRQILINLLGNSVKFTESGEVVLRVRNHAPGKSGQIEFAISDTGIGMSPDTLEKIFDDFTQANASTTRQYGGTGLGLGISRRLVEAMGGHLTASSAVGEGSTFRFVAQFDVAPQTARKVRASPKDHGNRVLLISDNATSSLILREMLQGFGLESDAYGLPADALARLLAPTAHEQPYSLAVIDLSMPATDAFAVIAEIRRISSGLPIKSRPIQSLSIVLLDSNARLGDAARRVEAGLSGYALKPVARSRFLGLVSAALGEGKSQQCPAGSVDNAGSVDHREPLAVQPARILVVDDSENNRLLFQAYLRASQYQLTFEEDGKAAVDRFATSDFDLILMDVEMPGMDGLAATRAIRALERERGARLTPIIAVSADVSAEDIERTGHAGCTAYLTKPVSKLNLLRVIERHRRAEQPEETVSPRETPASVARMS